MKSKMTQRRSWTLAAACGATLLLAATGCQTGATKGDDTTLPVATASQVTTAKPASACGRNVVAESGHAVGNPCLTTADFARSLGVKAPHVKLTKAKLAKVHKKTHKKKAAHH